MSNDDVVTYAINEFSDKFAHVAGIIAHGDHFPDLAKVCSMVTTEEMRLNSKQQFLPSDTISSAPTVLLAENNVSRDTRPHDTRDNLRCVSLFFVLFASLVMVGVCP